MTVLFRRDYALVVNSLRITGLDIAFDVMRTLKKEPNTADITVRNLNESNRARLQGEKIAQVVLDAGYRRPPGETAFPNASSFNNASATIFNGQLREIWTERDGGTILTRITSGDGERSMRTKRVNKSFRRGATLKNVIEECADALGLGLGNLRELQNPRFRTGAVFPGGTVVSGNAAQELESLLRSAGLTYSIQNGKIQILPLRRALAGEALVLSPDTGMIDVPSVSSDGIVRARTLMIPDLFPGRKVQFSSENVTGFAVVETARYTGDTTTNEWFTEIEAKRLQ